MNSDNKDNIQKSPKIEEEYDNIKNNEQVESIVNNAENNEEIKNNNDIKETNNINIEKDNNVEFNNNDQHYFIPSLKYGLKETFVNKSSWLFTIPVFNIFIILFYMSLLIFTVYIVSDISYQSGQGLRSGNPLPFILLTLEIIVSTVLLIPIIKTIATNSAIKNVSHGFELNPGEVFTFNNGAFKNTFLTYIYILLIITIISVPFNLLSFGSTLTTGNMHNIYSIISLILGFLIVLITPILSYAPLIINDKYNNHNINNEIKPHNIFFTMNKVIDFKKHYTNLLTYEIGFAFINLICGITLIGLIVSLPLTTLARGYIYRKIVKQ